MTNNVGNKQSLTTILTKLSLEELGSRDVFGRTIIHIVILCNRADLLRHLLKNVNVKSFITKTDYENGWNCLHYIVYYKQLNCYRVLLEFCKTSNISRDGFVAANSVLYELIRTKDRNRLTPFQLLDNDFKSCIWVPDYITKNDMFHFKYRFEDVDRHNQALLKQDSDSGDSIQKPVQVRHIMSHYNWWDTKRCGSDVYMFGSNVNNNLGLGDASDRQFPSKLPTLWFKTDNKDLLINPRFKSVKTSKNHSVVVTKDGNVFSCGIASRGRLGHDGNTNLYRFKRIKLFQLENKFIKDILISNDHSIALTTDNEIYCWGMNNYNQCVLTPQMSLDNYESLPRLICSGDIKKNVGHFKGIASSKVHSLAFTKHDVFLWGLNLGQMGFNSDSGFVIDYNYQGSLVKGIIQMSPRKISLRDEIKLVDTCETATCIVTSQNDVHIYYQSQHVKLPKIAIRGSLDRNFHIFSPVKTTRPANIVKVVMRSPENVALLLDSGDILGFGIDGLSAKVKYNNIWKSHDSDLRVCDMDMSTDGSIILCTSTGNVFMKKHQNSKSRKNSASDKGLQIAIKNKFTRVEFINKIVRVNCDDTFTSFGFIRDDIDSIPLELTTNTFIKDMESLSPLSSYDMYRKQDELLHDRQHPTYISDFIYPNSLLQNDEEYETDEDEVDDDNDETNLKFDWLLTSHMAKYDANVNKKIKTRRTYQQMNDPDKELVNNVVESKHYDFFIQCGEFKIGLHKSIAKVRSSFITTLIESGDDQFITEDLQGSFLNNILTIVTPINPKAIIILVYFIYTNRVIFLWGDYPTLRQFKDIKNDFDKLCKLFRCMDVFGTLTKDETFFTSLRSLLNTEYPQGLTINYIDGSMRLCKEILLSRSAFFETILSDRWTKTSQVSLNITEPQCMVIFKHLFGYSDLKIFDDLIQTSEDVDEFINNVLGIIGVADELLLFQLKDLCQLVLKDLLNLDNVVELLIYSHLTKSKKLFLNCCWYVYNNLDIILLNQSVINIPSEVINELETQMKVLNQFQANDSYQQNKTSNWMINDSNNLIGNFIHKIALFNDNLVIHGRGYFTPVFDVKIDVVKGKRSRKSSRKSSSVETPDISDLKAQLVQNYNENAIDDSSDYFQEFEPVVRRRRKTVEFESKAKPAIATPQNKPVIIAPSIKPVIKKVAVSSSSFPVLGQPQSSASNGLASNNGSSSSINTSGLSPHSNWAAKSNANSIFSDNLKTNDIPTKMTKPKVGPNIKLSQRERKKLASQGNHNLNDNVTSVSAWGEAGSIMIKNTKPASSDSVKNFPVLGSASSLITTSNTIKPSSSNVHSNKSMNSQPSSRSISNSSSTSNSISNSQSNSKTNLVGSDFGITLTDIMIQESLKFEVAKVREAERKTLSEIQQEEEFNKWWQQEAAKVQQQMQSMDIKKKKKRHIHRHKQ